MAHVQRMLLSRIILTGDLVTPLNFGITEEDFTTTTDLQMFRNLMAYYESSATYGSILGPNILQEKYPGYELVDDPAMTTATLCHEVRTSRIQREIEGMAKELLQNKGDPRQSLSVAQDQLASLLQLATSKQVDVDIADAIGELYEDYQLEMNGIFPNVVVPWPWPAFNDDTRGLQNSDYVCLYGRPKNGKSWALCFILSHLVLHSIPTLVYTKEMTTKDIYRRTVGCLCELPYTGFRMARLMPDDYQRFLNTNAAREDLRNTVKCLSAKDAVKGGDTVAWLEAKVRQYKPRVVLIDGLYLMSDGAGPKSRKPDHQRVADISRALRQMQLSLGVACIVTMQANRKAALTNQASSEDIAYTDAIAQDLTLGIRTIADPYEPFLNLVIGQLQRETRLQGIKAHFEPARNFSEYAVLDSREAQKAKEIEEEMAAAEQSGRSIAPPSVRTNKASRASSNAGGGQKAPALSGSYLDNMLHGQ